MSSTLLLPVDPENIGAPASQTSLQTAASILRAGGIVAFPTETVYGLGANALDAAAVDRIFEAKQRPAWDPLIVHIADQHLLQMLVLETSAADRTLMAAFWPGALTLLLPRQQSVPPNVTAGRSTIGVRMPSHPVARELLRLADIPIAAPSANSFSKISPTTARHVLEDLDGRIDAVVDGGATSLGLESTVMDANARPPIVYRPGMISIEQLRLHLPDIVAYTQEQTSAIRQAQPSPGTGERHYAPQAELIVIAVDQFAAAIEHARQLTGLTGVLLPQGLNVEAAASLQIFHWGEWDDQESLARNLYAGLRELDQRGVQRILCPRPSDEGIGSALCDRLQKAARPRT